jgi:predicted permease
VAACCVLLVVAGLLARAIHHAITGNPGFEYKQVISVDPRLAIHGYSASAARAYLDRLQDRLWSLPRVESVSLAVTPPLGNRRTTLGGEKDGRSFAIYLNRIHPDFFATMKIPLLRGRNLQPGETRSVVVSESLARRMWPSEDPLEKQFSIGAAQHPVVGVAGNARGHALSDVDAVEVYQPIEEPDLPAAVLLVRVAGPVEGALQSIADAARASDAMVIPAVQTLNTAFARKIEGTQRSAAAASVLAGVALLLACLGIVGVVTYVASQRVKEIGIRLALGAMPSDILAVIVRQFWPPILAGLVAGAGGAAALSHLLRRELFGVSHLDPIAYLSAAAVLAITAAAAVVVPARRALRMDPMRSLRCE